AGVAALQRDMQMAAQLRLGGEGVQQLIGHLRRLDGGETYPLDARNLRQTQEQVGQIGSWMTHPRPHCTGRLIPKRFGTALATPVARAWLGRGSQGAGVTVSLPSP